MAGARSTAHRRWLRGVQKLFVFLCATLVAFWLFEGLCSTIWVSSQVVGTRLTAERLHTRFDPDLGWVSIPNVSLPDLYGPGIGLTTNARGFRGPGEVVPLAPGGHRLICSGDSFTLGYGVGDLETWCHQLGLMEPGLDAVNMGQGGYGVDQAFLWYMRDGRKLEHQVHVFAFIADDLRRMLESDYYGFGKPRLELEAGHVVARNVPVPRSAYIWPWLTAQRVHLHQLRSYALISKLWRRVRPLPEPPSTESFLTLVFATFDELEKANNDKGSRLLIVYLPMYPECLPGADDTLRKRLMEESTRHKLAFVDLTDTFSALPPAVLEQMYLAGPPSSRHLSARGHLLVAQTLYPRVAAMLQTAAVTTTPAEAAREGG